MFIWGGGGSWGMLPHENLEKVCSFRSYFQHSEEVIGVTSYDKFDSERLIRVVPGSFSLYIYMYIYTGGGGGRVL